MPTRMPTRRESAPAAALLRAAVCAWALLAGHAACAWSEEASALRSQHETLRASLAGSPFHRPLIVQSSESDEASSGEVHAVVDQPFDTTAQVLRDKSRWCELLL